MKVDFFITFINVVEKESFSGAAKAMSVSQPTISFQIQSLEEEYNEQLLDRSGPKVELTKAGKVFLQFAKEIVQSNQLLKERLAELRGTLTGKIRIGASTIPGEYIVPSFLGQFKLNYPSVDLTMEISDSQDVIDKLVRREIDIGFIGKKPDHSRLKTHQIAQDELFFILPPKHRLSRKKTISVDDILDEPFLLREKGSGTRASFEKALEKKGHTVSDLHSTMELGSTQAIITGVENGLGISVVSNWAIQKNIELETLKATRVTGMIIKRPLLLTFLVQRVLSRLQREFISFGESFNLNPD